MKDIIYHSRKITTADVVFIKELIAKNPGKSRRFISQELCRQWNWRQANGALKDMVCRGLLLKLHREGLITLPARKRVPHNPFLNRKPPKLVSVDQSPVVGSLKDIRPIILRSVRKTEFENRWKSRRRGVCKFLHDNSFTFRVYYRFRQNRSRTAQCQGLQQDFIDTAARQTVSQNLAEKYWKFWKQAWWDKYARHAGWKRYWFQSRYPWR